MRYISFPCLIVLARTSRTTMNRNVETEHLCFILSLSGKAFSLSPLSRIQAVGLSYMAFIMLKNTKMKIWSYTEYIIQWNKNAFMFFAFAHLLSEKLVAFYNWFLCFYFSIKTLLSHQWFYLWLVVRKPLLSALLSNLTMKKLTCIHIRADIDYVR